MCWSHRPKTTSGFKQEKDSSQPITNTSAAHNSTAKSNIPAKENLRPAIGSVEKDKATDAVYPPRCYTLYIDLSIITPASPAVRSAAV